MSEGIQKGARVVIVRAEGPITEDAVGVESIVLDVHYENDIPVHPVSVQLRAFPDLRIPIECVEFVEYIDPKSFGTDYKIEDLKRVMSETPLHLLVPHIEDVFYKQEKPPRPDLAELYVVAQNIEEMSEALSTAFRMLRGIGEDIRPANAFLRDLVLNARGLRQQFEQLLFDGDPNYTGKPKNKR